MKYFIFLIVFLIAAEFSIFSSYMFFVPYEAFSFLILTILLIANNFHFTYSPNKFYFAAFLIGFIMDCMQHNVVFYYAFIFTLIVFLNDFTKSIFGSKFFIGLVLLIGIYDIIIFRVPILISSLNVLLLYIFCYLVQRLLPIVYVKKD
ncbi:MAG: hypothetical protein ACPLXO_00490 [Desulfurella sp.]|uniref:hypothetical protein n=1 Tax=Desulfurella sp. TaxID=1962857 RepID=UPI003C8C085E